MYNNNNNNNYTWAIFDQIINIICTKSATWAMPIGSWLKDELWLGEGSVVETEFLWQEGKWRSAK